MNMIVGSAALAAATSIRSADALENPDAQLEGLWLERKALLTRRTLLQNEYDRAYENIPDWAKVGRSQVDCEGNKCGAVSSCPEMVNPYEKSGGPGMYRTIRPSRPEHRRLLRVEADIFGHKNAAARYKDRMRAYIARSREQRRLLDSSVSRAPKNFWIGR